VLRSRNDGTEPVFFFEAGKAHFLAFRLPERESDHTASARPQSHGGLLERLLAHLAPPLQPVTNGPQASPSVSTVNNVARVLGFFHALNAWIRSNRSWHVGVRGVLALGERGFHHP